MPAMTTEEETRLLNETLFEKLASNDAQLVKQGLDAVDDFTRTKVREEGVYRRVLPMVPIKNDDLDRMPHTSKPVKVVDKEPDSPAAVTIPFGALPESLWVEGDRYVVPFARIVGTRFYKDVEDLRTWHMDIRQVLSDNSIKDMLAEEDAKFFGTVDSMLVGPGAVVPTSGTVQWEQISGGISRDTLFDMLKIMPNTPSNIETHTIVLNHITIKDFCKFTRDEQGGDMSQDIMKSGWTSEQWGGKQLIITIKKALVPTGTFYMFGDPKFIGKSYALEDITMYMRREAYMLEFFPYETIGGAIGHTGGLARADIVA